MMGLSSVRESILWLGFVPPRRCTGCFAELVTWNMQKSEAALVLGKGLTVGLDNNLDGVFAGKDLDTDRSIPEVDLVTSSVVSSNDSVGHDRGLILFVYYGRALDAKAFARRAAIETGQARSCCPKTIPASR